MIQLLPYQDIPQRFRYIKRERPDFSQNRNIRVGLQYISFSLEDMWTCTFQSSPPVTSWHSLKSYTCEHTASQKVMYDYPHLSQFQSSEGHVFSRVIRTAAQSCPCFRWQNSLVMSALSRPDQLLTCK